MSAPFRVLCVTLGLALLSGCGGGGASSSNPAAGVASSSSTPSTTTVATSNKSSQLSLSGTPATAATVGQTYSFTPKVSGASGTVKFSVQNAPSWLSLNVSTGALSGTPQAANAGTYTNIIVTASDGQSRASLGGFAITVAEANSGSGSATLSWTAPTSNTDGSVLTDLAGYKIYYGTSATALNDVVTVSNGITSYVVGGLTTGTWYFAIRSYTSAGTESALSNVASKTIT